MRTTSRTGHHEGSSPDLRRNISIVFYSNGKVTLSGTPRRQIHLGASGQTQGWIRVGNGQRFHIPHKTKDFLVVWSRKNIMENVLRQATKTISMADIFAFRIKRGRGAMRSWYLVTLYYHFADEN